MQRNSKGQFVKGHNGIPNKGNFKKGHITWNKGLKGIHLNSKTEFKKGNIPYNKNKPHPYGHRWQKEEHSSIETEIEKGQHLSPKTELTSKRAKALWKNPEKRVEMLKNQAKSRRSKSPSKPERRFIEINKKYNLGFIYTGNSPDAIIGTRYIPDFINLDKKIIVEILGDYWHNKSDIFARDRRKVRMYRFLGFKSFWFWASELDNEEEIIKWFKV